MRQHLSLLAAALLSGCFAAPANVGSTVTASMGPEGGRIVSADGRLTIDFPAGALSETETVTLARSASSPVPSNAQPVGPAYTLGPASLHLDAPAQATLDASSDAAVNGEQLGIFAAPQGEVSLVALPSTIDANGFISASLGGPTTLQAARFILVNDTSGDGAGSTSGTSGTTSASTGTIAASSTSGGSTTVGAAGSSSGSGTTGGGDYCGGGAGATGGAGMLQHCQLISVRCDGSSQDEVDCSQGNCVCKPHGQPVSAVQEPSTDCAQAWRDCGLPPSPVVNGGGTGTTTGGESPGGTASIHGDVAFTADGNSFTAPDDGSQYALEVSLAQDGLCGGFEANGLSAFIGLVSDAPIAPGSYALSVPRSDQASASITVSNWDPGAGAYGVVGSTTDGTLTITAFDGATISGSFDANFDLGSGAPTQLTGTFSAVPVCTR